MAEVPFRPVRQLSEYKGKGASASREFVLPKTLAIQTRINRGVILRRFLRQCFTAKSRFFPSDYMHGHLGL